MVYLAEIEAEDIVNVPLWWLYRWKSEKKKRKDSKSEWMKNVDARFKNWR